MKSDDDIKLIIEEKQKELQGFIDAQAAMAQEFNQKTGVNQRGANACEGAIAALTALLETPVD